MYRIRFILLILKSFLSRKKDLLEDVHLSFFTIPFIDTDLSRLFTHTYTEFMGLGRWHFMLRTRFREVVIKKFWAPVTATEVVCYKRSIRFFTHVKLRTRLIYWNEKRFYVEQTFFVNEEIYAKGYVEGLLRSGKDSLRPPEVFKELGVEQGSPPMPNEVKKLFGD